MKHIAWVSPDDIIISNSHSESYKDMSGDIKDNNINKVRVLEDSKNSYIRYVINCKRHWFLMGGLNFINGIYYTSIIKLSEMETERLDNIYKYFNREDNLNKLLS